MSISTYPGVSEQITQELWQRVATLQCKLLFLVLSFAYLISSILSLCRQAAEKTTLEGKCNIALKKEQNKVSQLEARLADMEKSHRAELERVNTAAAQSVSESTKHLEDAAR